MELLNFGESIKPSVFRLNFGENFNKIQEKFDFELFF